MMAEGASAHSFGPLATVAIVVLFAALVAVVLARSAPTGQPTLQTATQPPAPASSIPQGGPVLAVSIDGVVDPPVSAYLHRALAQAEARHAAAVIISLTPSAGLDRSVQGVAHDLEASAIPTLAYLPPGQTSAVATELVQATGGAAVEIPASAEWVQMDPVEALWHRLLDPTTAYLFLVLGLFAVFVEIAHPGALAPGITGVVSLALAAFAFSTLPTNWLGVLTLLAGVALMGAELKAARHGALVVLGVVCLGLGSAMLYTLPGSLTPALIGVLVSPLVVVGVVLSGLAFGVLITRLARRIHQMPPMFSLEQLIGARGVSRTRLEPDGVVHVGGQLWSARVRGRPLERGEAVRVLARHGLVLEVESATFRAAATQKGANS
jgi:membrane-bound serine protease (ClpP class)